MDANEEESIDVKGLPFLIEKKTYGSVGNHSRFRKRNARDFLRIRG